jgi:hypothetical protein
MHYEHRERNYAMALEMTHSALWRWRIPRLAAARAALAGAGAGGIQGHAAAEARPLISQTIYELRTLARPRET